MATAPASMRYAVPLLALAAFACATPTRSLQWHTLSAETWWEAGRQYARSDDDGIEVEAAFEGGGEDEATVRVTVTNASRAPVLVDPAAFYYATTEGRIAAMDPEARLARVERAIAREEADYRNDQALTAVRGCVGMLGMFAALSGSDEDRQRATAAADDASEDHDRREQAHHRRMATLTERRTAWSEEALRRSTLRPGESCSGFVRFPAGSGVGDLRVVFAVGEARPELAFRQTGL